MFKNTRARFGTKRDGFTLVEILIVVGVIGLILTGLVLSLNSKQKQLRDAKRLTDVNTIKDALQVVKNETGSYERAYCDLTFVSLCSKNENSELLKILPELAQVNDPDVMNVACTSAKACYDSGCNYTFTKLDENDFEVYFHLEKGIDEFKSKGCYKVTPLGITKL